MIPDQTSPIIMTFTDHILLFINSASFLSLATLVAIFLSPIFALRVSAHLDRKKETIQRRMDIFRALMKTRNTQLDAHHVQALNLIEVDFHGAVDVVSAYADYIKFRRKKEPTERALLEEHYKDGQTLLMILIHKISLELKYKFDKKDLEDNAYAPVGWQNTASLNEANALALNKLLHGETKLPISVSAEPSKSLEIDKNPT